MKTNLSSQITLNRVSPRYYRPATNVERSILTRYERLTTDIFPTVSEGALSVATEIAAKIRERQSMNQTCVIGVVGGNSPAAVYSCLVRMHREEGLSFHNVVVFMAYEYFPLPADSDRSCFKVVYDQFLSQVDIKEENIHRINGHIRQEDVPHHCYDYEEEIRKAGGLDIMLLGVGLLGNIAMNAPGSTSASRTRMVLLDEVSRSEARNMFGGTSQVPPCGITIGINTILNSHKIFLVAWGDAKAEVMRTTIEEPANEHITASFLQLNMRSRVVMDLSAATHLTRIRHPWLVTSCDWNDKLIRSAIVWLCQITGKPILKLTNQDYNEHALGELLAIYGSAYNVNIKIFNDLQHTITGWPGGKPDADDTYRPERALPYPKRVIIFSPHPDDDVISMGGTLQRLVKQGHDVHVAYETSGNIAVTDEEVQRFLHFVKGYNEMFKLDNDDAKQRLEQLTAALGQSKFGTPEILGIKGLIRRGEARLACQYSGVAADHVHFLSLPFYETGQIEKNQIGETDVNILRNLLQEVQPHQIFVAGDLADPHGTHRICTDAVLAAIDMEKEAGAKWLDHCRIWMYRGAWAEWEIEHIEMVVPISPEELRQKRNAILRHQSQMESAPFLGDDDRLFWQRSETRNHATANLYNQLGLAAYEAMEAFVQYTPT